MQSVEKLQYRQSGVGAIYNWGCARNSYSTFINVSQETLTVAKYGQNVYKLIKQVPENFKSRESKMRSKVKKDFTV